MLTCVNRIIMARLQCYKRAILSILLLLGVIIIYYEYTQYRNSDSKRQNLMPLNRWKIEKTHYMKNYTDLYLITYANERFFLALENLIGSVHFWEPELRIVIYDVGLTEKQAREVSHWKNVQYKYFNFSLYPPHVKQLKKYAFKPIIWNETFHDYGYIFIQDAGQEFRKKIDPIRNIIQKEGFFSAVTGSESIAKNNELTHPLTQKYLNITLQKRQCDGSTIGIKKDHSRGENIRKLLHDAVTCSLVERCIAPEGSSLDNHRYDQAVLTLLTQKYNFTCGGTKGCFVGPESPHKLTDDPKTTNDYVICSRRMYEGRQYTQFLIKEN